MGRMTELKHKETFLGDTLIYVLYLYMYVLHLDAYIIIGIYQNLFNYTLKYI